MACRKIPHSTGSNAVTLHTVAFARHKIPIRSTPYRRGLLAQLIQMDIIGLHRYDICRCIWVRIQDYVIVANVMLTVILTFQREISYNKERSLYMIPTHFETVDE